MGAGGEQMRGGLVTGPGAAHGLAVDGHRQPCGLGPGAGPVELAGGPGRGDRLERLPVDPGHDPAEGGLAGRPDRCGQRVRCRAQGQQQRRVRGSRPLRGPAEGLEPGAGHAHHQHPEHERGRVPPGPTRPRVGHRAQRGQPVNGIGGRGAPGTGRGGGR